jgi:hypothetical protein
MWCCWNRLRRIQKQANGRVRLVLHGTNGFPDELTRECIDAGISKINVNKLVLSDYNQHLKTYASSLPQTQLIEEGTAEVVKMQEHQMRVCRSAGRCWDVVRWVLLSSETRVAVSVAPLINGDPQMEAIERIGSHCSPEWRWAFGNKMTFPMTGDRNEGELFPLEFEM